MKITSLFTFALLAFSISILATSCTCQDEGSRNQTEKEKIVPR